MAKQDNIIIGLDIGTTKICAIVGEVKQEGLEIIGIGTHPSKGLRKGVVVNIDSTVQSIKKAIEEAELMAGCELNTAYVGIAGGHIKGFNSHGVIAVKDKEITKADIARVIEAAQAITIPTDREVIHVIPQEYILDNQDCIQEPLGMSGVRLEAKVHIVTAAVASAQNIVKSVNKAGLAVADVVLQQIASSEAVLGQDEKDIGVALIDIGGGTTDIAIYHNGTIKHTAVISLGGNQITGDIAVGLRTPSEEAEKVKKKFGCCMTSMIDKDETIEVGEQISNLPVRRGLPAGIGGLVDIVKNPMYSTGVGLVLYGMKHGTLPPFNGRGDKQVFNRLLEKMKGWVKEFF